MPMKESFPPPPLHAGLGNGVRVAPGDPCASGTVASRPCCFARGTQSSHCHRPRGAGRDPNIWLRHVSPATSEAAGAGEQLVGGQVRFLPFWLAEKGALSSLRVSPVGLFSCLSSHGCCAIGLETKGARGKES